MYGRSTNLVHGIISIQTINQATHMSSQHFLSHRHKSRQHHVPKQLSRGGEGIIQSHVESDMFTNKFILKFCAIIIVSAGKYGLGFTKQVKND